MYCKSSLVALTLAALSLTSAGSPAGATEPPVSRPVALRQAGTTVVYFQHGQWVSFNYGTHAAAVQALNEFHRLGIQAYIR
jgi:hypothetical protein